ncbi:MAG: GerW family sporulation protein [Angelakisella sp.]|nr:GerW family sporulation protein [Angelakisella sp.]
MSTRPLGELNDSSMKNLQTLIDSNTVIGTPINTADGTVILPVSKVSFGFATGGSDLPSSQKELFGGGSGGGVTITPIAFLVVKNGDVKLLQLQAFHNTADRMVGMVPEVMDKVSGIVSGLTKKDEPPKADTSAAP